MEEEGIVLRRTKEGIGTEINLSGCSPQNLIAYIHMMGLIQTELTKLLLEAMGRKISDVEMMEVRKGKF